MRARWGRLPDSDASDVARARDRPTRTERRRRARFNSVKLECPACGQEIRSNALQMHLQKCAGPERGGAVGDVDED